MKTFRLMVLAAVVLVAFPARAGEAFQCPGPVDLPAPLVGDHLLLENSVFEQGIAELELWSLDSGQLVQNLTGPLGLEAMKGVFSPDLTRVAFEGYREGIGTRVWIVDVDGTDPRIVSPDFATAPAWSPDGQQLAYRAWEGLAILDLATCQEELVHAGAGTPEAVVWSPNGDLIAFEWRTEGDTQIHVLSLADGSVTQVTFSSGGSVSPAFSPDGSQIAYRAFGEGPESIWVSNVDGTGAQPLYGIGANDFHPTWSPDGTRVAVESVDADASILIVDLMANTATDFVTTPIPGPRWKEPVWSPVFRDVAQPVPPVTTTTIASTDGGEATTTTSHDSASDTSAAASDDSGATGDDGLPPLVWLALGALVGGLAVALILLARSGSGSQPPPPPPAI